MFFPISGAHISPIYLAIVGFLIGILGGFFGVGGSFIAGPALRLAGLDWNFAVGTDLAHIVGKSVVAVRRHRALGNVDLRLGLIMAVGTIGGAVAVNLAAALSEVATDGAEPPTATPLDHVLPAAGLIIESTFTTLADMAKEVTWVPVGVLLSQKFDSVSKMAKVNIPVLVVHGAADRFVPLRFSQALYDAATAKKRLLLVEGGSHNNSMRAGADDYRRALSELFGLGAQPEPITARRTPRGVRG